MNKILISLILFPASTFCSSETIYKQIDLEIHNLRILADSENINQEKRMYLAGQIHGLYDAQELIALEIYE